MKKWITSGILYLVIVIAVFNIVGFISSDNEDLAHDREEHLPHDEDVTDSHDHGHGHSSEGSDVNVDIKVSGQQLTIYLTDQEGNAIEELEVNHEKLLHLIIVDDHLEQYYHLHPEQIDVGVFQTFFELPEGSYKAFVDIAPKGLAYEVAPFPFTIGEEEEDHHHDHLTVDSSLTKSINNYEVTLEPSSLSSEEEVTLNFVLPEDANIEPYLGALGHVVILDEKAEKYLHVHPQNENEPLFETLFEEPGIYKIWAEFKIDGEVVVFPYVVKVK